MYKVKFCGLLGATLKKIKPKEGDHDVKTVLETNFEIVTFII